MTVKSLFLSLALVCVPAFAVAQEVHDQESHAHEVIVGSITVSHPWARAAQQGGDTLVFMEFSNSGEPDTLESVASAVATVAGVVGVSFNAGDMETIPLDDFEIPSGDFDFDPAGVAILFEGLSQNLHQGDIFEMELEFHDAGTLHVEVEVEAADATQHSHAGHSH